MDAPVSSRLHLNRNLIIIVVLFYIFNSGSRHIINWVSEYHVSSLVSSMYGFGNRSSSSKLGQTSAQPIISIFQAATIITIICSHVILKEGNTVYGCLAWNFASNPNRNHIKNCERIDLECLIFARGFSFQTFLACRVNRWWILWSAEPICAICAQVYLQLSLIRIKSLFLAQYFLISSLSDRAFRQALKDLHRFWGTFHQ